AAARPGIGGGARGGALPRADAGPTGAAVHLSGGPAAGHAGAASHAARRHREQLSAPAPGAPAVLHAPVGVPRRVDAGSGDGRGGGGGGPRGGGGAPRPPSAPPPTGGAPPPPPTPTP